MPQPANKRLVTEASMDVALDAEAALARNADNLLSGTVADARIPSTIARDSEVTAAVAAEAALARDAANLTSGLINDARIPSTITRDTELDAEAALARNADNLTSGTVADARIASTIARDSEVTAAVASEATLARNADNLTSGTVVDARIPSTITRDSELAAEVSTINAALALKAPAANPTFTGVVDADGATSVLVPTPAALDSSTKAASTAYVQGELSALGSAIPAGMIAPFAGASGSVPAGWLLCDGTAVSQTTYAGLYAVVGANAFGTDSGGNFSLPNLKGKVPVGFNSAETEFDTRGETGGAKTHTLTEAQLPAHDHPLTGSFRTDLVATGGSGAVTAVGNVGPGGGTADNSGDTGDAGSGQAHNNLQPYIVLHYIIKY